jgi:hypothetical protein
VLTECACTIAPSTFHDNLTRARSRRAVRDAELKDVIAAEPTSRFITRICARKLWLHLRRQGACPLNGVSDGFI